MGITGGGFLDPEAARLLGLDQEQGFLIFAIRPGGPADKAGLQAGGEEIVNIGGRQIPIDGDIIISIDGKQMNERGDECSVLEQKMAGDSVRLVIYRDGSLQETNLILEETPPGQPSTC
jgi:S1-C subfamily serine protease